MPFVDTSTQAHLHYEVLGNSQPVVAIHGFMRTARHDLGRVLDWLSQDYQVFGLTLRGYGDSGPKPRDFPLNFYHRDAADMLAFLDAVGLEKVHLLGYSDGGEVSLIAAGTQPERFKSVAVWGAVGYYGPAMRPAVQRMYPPTWFTDELKTLHGIANPEPMVLQWIQTVKQLIDSGGDVSLSLAHNITCPLLLMLGDQDRLNPEEYGRKFIEQTPAGRLKMFPCGHRIHDEQWDSFQRVVRKFLSAV